MKTQGKQIIACRDCLGMGKVRFNPAGEAELLGCIEILVEPIRNRTPW
jgi:hypothetical protein